MFQSLRLWWERNNITLIELAINTDMTEQSRQNQILDRKQGFICPVSMIMVSSTTAEKLDNSSWARDGRELHSVS